MRDYSMPVEELWRNCGLRSGQKIKIKSKIKIRKGIGSLGNASLQGAGSKFAPG
jgi:hypothetical protein